MRTKLRKLRESRGYTQQSFADRIGISRSHYSQIETGEKGLSYKLSVKIKHELDYYGEDLFYNKKCP